MKLTYSSQNSLLHSESIYIGCKLTTPTVHELCPPQDGLHEQEQEKRGQNNIQLRREIPLQFIKVDYVTDELFSI